MRIIALSLLLINLATANLITANYKNFKEVVLDSPHITMVEFFAPWCGHCKNFEPEYIQAAKRLKGFAKLVQVDCDNSINREICGRYDVKGFPTIKIFNGGVPTDYQGERKAKAVVDTLIPLIPSKYVKKIGGKSKKAINLEDFQVLSDGKLHKVLLVTDKKATPPLFKALSIEFRDRLVFGEIRKSDSKDVIASSFGITEFPTILVLPKEKDGNIVTYKGGAKYAELSSFLTTYAAPESPKKEKVKNEKKDKAKNTKNSSKSSSKPATSTPPVKAEEVQEPFDPSINELTCEDCLEKKCLRNAGTCVITFLTKEDDYPESVAAFEESKKILQKLKKKYHARNAKVTFVWVNAIKNGKQLIRDFGVSDMFPSVIAIDKKNSQYGLLRSSFEEQSLSNFLDVFLGGGGRTKLTKKIILGSVEKQDAGRDDEL